MANPETSKKSERLPLRTRIAAATMIGAGAAAMAACSPQGESPESPTHETTISAEPTNQPTIDIDNPVVESPTAAPTETETAAAEYQMSAEVDYALFDNWESLSQRDKLERMDTLYAANGIQPIEAGSLTGYSPEQFNQAWMDRYMIAVDVNKDAHDERNDDVAAMIIETLTVEGKARDDYIDGLALGRQYAGEPDSEYLDYLHGMVPKEVTVYSMGLWFDQDYNESAYTVEQRAEGKFGSMYIQTEYIQLGFPGSQNEYLLVADYAAVDRGDAPLDFGPSVRWNDESRKPAGF